MTAAYATIVSLMHLTDQILLHPSCRKKTNEELLEQIKTLHEAVGILKDFLESDVYRCGTEVDGLESRIANAAYVVEDIMYFCLEDILAESPQEQVKEENDGKTAHFGHGFEKAVGEIKKEAMVATEKLKLGNKTTNFHEDLMRSVEYIYSIDKIAPALTTDENLTNDELIHQLMQEIIGGPTSREIISINGMGGIGKTTLAKIIYAKPAIRQHFDVCTYLTISPEYDEIKLLVSLLHEARVPLAKVLATTSKGMLGTEVYKHLYGRRYFIVLDDVWSTNVWENLMQFFPKNSFKCRIMITTRNSDVAKRSIYSHEMNLLDEAESWCLLQKKVFGEKDCPLELEKIGKNIARDCRGLPLAINVIGRELANTRMALNEWKKCAKELNKIIDAHCLGVLSSSYEQLPIHLKPCFLYMGVYPENCEVYVPGLIKRWVAEGFLKPFKAKSIQEVAEEYLKELVDRHLISLVKWGRLAEIKVVGMHALTRSLCLRKAGEERFHYITNVDNRVSSMNSKDSVAIQLVTSFSSREYTTLHSTESPFSNSLKLMRVFNLKRIDIDTANAFLKLVNSGYLKFNNEAVATLEIWKMPELIHLIIDRICLSDPQSGEGNETVLENLKTLSCVHNYNCLEVVTKRMSGIKKLGIAYSDGEVGIAQGLAHYHLQNLSRLHKLQSLTCTCRRNEGFLTYAMLPHSLKKLTLECNIDWNDVSTKVASLPNLEKFKLETFSSGESWILGDEKFSRLMFLGIKCRRGLVYWEAEDFHFPRLERLLLISMDELQEFPIGIGDIPTLHSIELVGCSETVITSAKNMLEEQHSFYGNDTLQLVVKTDS